MSEKRASTDYPISELVAERWSPYAFDNRPVPEADLRSLFERHQANGVVTFEYLTRLYWGELSV